MSLFKLFIADESGSTGIEYAMIGVFMSVMVIGGATTIGTKMNGHFSAVGSGLQ